MTGLRTLLLAATCLLAGSAAGQPAAPPSSGAADQAAASSAGDVEPGALAALSHMGAYLRTLQAFTVKASTTTEEVTDDGQKLQFAGVNSYQVRRPNGFRITVADDRKVRQLYYDGRKLTLYSPRMGFYASVPAPPTIRATLDQIADKYGIELPLEDLFRWGQDGDRRDQLKSGFLVGYARIDGFDTDQYAFSEDGVDWQIWIQRGVQPVPRKVVIVSTDDDAHPEFSAVLSWNVHPALTAASFAFKPPADSKPITLATVQQ